MKVINIFVLLLTPCSFLWGSLGETQILSSQVGSLAENMDPSLLESRLDGKKASEGRMECLSAAEASLDKPHGLQSVDGQSNAGIEESMINPLTTSEIVKEFYDISKNVCGFDTASYKFCAELASCSYLAKESDLDQSSAKMEYLKNLSNKGYVVDFIYSNDPNVQGVSGVTIFKDGDLYIAFRGTSDLTDWCTDANGLFKKRPYWLPVGSAHWGFANRFESIRPSLEEKVSLYKDATDRVTVIGHSLGGAIAELCALYYKGLSPRVITFGSPRVFSNNAAAYYEEFLGKNTLRVTNHHADSIPAVAPGVLGYKHVGQNIRNDVPWSAIDKKNAAGHSMELYKRLASDKLEHMPLPDNTPGVLGTLPHKIGSTVEACVGWIEAKLAPAFSKVKKFGNWIGSFL